MKKSKMIVALLIALMMVFTVVLSACNKDKHTHTFAQEWSSNSTYHWHKATCEHTSEVSDRGTHELDGNNVCKVCGRNSSLDEYRSYISADLGDIKNAIGSVSTTVDAAVNEAYNAGLEAIQSANTVSAIKSAYDNAKSAMVHCVPLASGIYDYTGLSQAGKTEILGLLESYAVRTGLTGVSLFENGSYVMYNPRVTLGTENYITGYGFGVLSEGAITADLTYEQTQAWKRYYHSLNSQDPGGMNTLNDKGSETDDFYSYVAASYYTVFMNATKDGYDWVPELAAGEVEPVGALNESGQTNHWRFEIRQGLKYSTLGKYANEYNDLEVQPEDFITPFKLLLNQGNNYYRGTSLANSTGASTIAGAKTYYNATAGKRKGILTEEEQKFEDVVGVKVVKEGDKWYFDYTLGANVTAWYARYYISSSLYMPIPASFIEKVGVDAYLGFTTNGSDSPVDNTLSLGAYTLERWDSNQQIVYKKNTNYVYSDSKYSIEGVHINIVPGTLTNPNLAFEEYLAGHIDAASIPQDYLEEYANKPETRRTTGNNVFKLNMNALNAQDWDYFFGANGSITQTPTSKRWVVEPAMSNAHFRSALSFALNRNEFGVNIGRVSTVNYFSSNYMSDPENGIAYNTTEAHKRAISGLINDDTDENGYSLELARDYFRMAIQELEAEGLYTRGTPQNPTKIQIEIAWQTPSNEEQYHKYVKQYWEDAFNDVSVTGGCYQLEVVFWVGNSWDDVYYNKMMVGQFDVAFGSISGNSQDPLGFMEVLSANQTISGDMTLNWAVDTNDPYADVLVYNGLLWSYDALHQSTQQATKVVGGKLVQYIAPDNAGFEFDQDRENLLTTITIDVADGVVIDEITFLLYGVLGGDDYMNVLDVIGDPVAGNGTLTYSLSISVEELLTLDPGYFADYTSILVYVSYHVPADNIEVEDLLLKQYSVEIASSYGLSTVVENDDSFTVSVDMKLTKGVTIDDIYFTFEGYTEDLDWGYVLLEDFDVTEGEGYITITFTVSKSALEESGISGEVVPHPTQQGKFVDLSGYQSLYAYVVLDDAGEVEFNTAYWNMVLVQPAPVQAE
ncbi:MAG: hypothetical protein J1F68_02835 [Clostridiales bacterium]|nr:hypothetical protein [Clostridiales bacterium]